MANIWEKFDNNIDVEGLKEDIKQAESNNSGDFVQVPHGSYEVKVEKIELKETKKGDPMLSIWFKVVAGEYKNQRIFYNQVIKTGFGIHFANEFLRSLNSGLDINFTNFEQYHNLLLDVEEVIDGKYEYALNYSANAKNSNFSDYEITEVFTL